MQDLKVAQNFKKLTKWKLIQFLLNIDGFKLVQKVTNIWATIVWKFAGQNFEKSPNLFTLFPTFISPSARLPEREEESAHPAAVTSQRSCRRMDGERRMLRLGQRHQVPGARPGTKTIKLFLL